MVRPLRGRNAFWASVSAGFTYGYSRCPASRDGNGAGTIEIVLILATMGQAPALQDVLGCGYGPGYGEVGTGSIRGTSQCTSPMARGCMMPAMMKRGT